MAGPEPEIIVRPAEGALSIDRLDAAWSAARNAEKASDSAPLFVNLDRVDFVHIEAMMMILALMVDRTRHGLATRLELPLQASPLNALRAWDFARVTLEATGFDLDEFLTQGSRQRFRNRAPEDSPYVTIVETPDDGEQMKLPASYFALTKVDMSLDPELAAESARNSMANRHLIEVLSDTLKQDGRRIGSFLVQEAIMNCVKHPGAKVAYTTMQIRRNEVSIVVWDDGHSFSSTFAKAKRGDSTLKSLAYGHASDKIVTSYIDRDDASRSREITMDSKTDDPLESEDFIPFAFVLGSSSTPEVLYPRESRNKGEMEQYIPSELIPYSGVGLHVIRKCVIDVFGGSIFYSAGGYRFDLRAKDKDTPGEYKGLLTTRRHSRPQVAGNLLVFHLPIPPRQRWSDRA